MSHDGGHLAVTQGLRELHAITGRTTCVCVCVGYVMYLLERKDLWKKMLSSLDILVTLRKFPSDVSHCSHCLSQWAHVNTLNTHVPVSLRCQVCTVSFGWIQGVVQTAWSTMNQLGVTFDKQHPVFTALEHDGICCLWHLKSWSLDCLRPRRDTKWNKNVQQHRNVVFTPALLFVFTAAAVGYTGHSNCIHKALWCVMHCQLSYAFCTFPLAER